MAQTRHGLTFRNNFVFFSGQNTLSRPIIGPMLACAVILGIVLSLLPTFGFAQTPPSPPNAPRDLCFLLTKDIPWQTKNTVEGCFPDYSSAPAGKYCGGCARGIANPAQVTAIAFLSVVINQFSTRERTLWEVNQGRSY